MSWNYRVICDGEGDDRYCQIHEVYYNSQEQITMISVDAITPGGESVVGLKTDLAMMQKSFDEPVLEKKEIVFHESDNL